uniref:CS domain-containing protein n=1 Tax=Bionectria ochroleuca TaxID=29856 RepID=A0A8H7TSX4_BIOOC
MAETATPEVLWAQRSSASEPEKNFVYLTISVPDVPKDGLKLDLKPAGLTFSGTSGTLKRAYHLELEFYAEIDPAESRINHTAKNVELKLQKKELQEEYWPRLLKEKKKLHFLKTDFDKWIDEDEQNEAPEEDFSQFGGMGGMPGMGGDFGGIDFSKLGGGGGDLGDLGGLGSQVNPDDLNDEDDDEEDDDDIPALEEDKKEEKKA